MDNSKSGALTPPSTPGKDNNNSASHVLIGSSMTTSKKKKKVTTFVDSDYDDEDDDNIDDFVFQTPALIREMPPPSSASRPTPEQFVFDVHLFSEKKKNVSHTPRCPSPPLKLTPASRVMSFNSNVPTVHHLALSSPVVVPPPTASEPSPATLSVGLFSSLNSNSSSSSSSEQRIGSVFDHNFEIVARLGSGSFSDVYKTQSKQDRKLYAVKQARHQFRGYQERDRAILEVKNATSLAPHNNIVQYYNCWEQAGILYIQTELCERGTLKDLLDMVDEATVLPEELVWNLLLDCCLGVQHIHQANMLHLDIKPENLFISSHGRLKIGDFGMAVQLVEQPQQQQQPQKDASGDTKLNTSISSDGGDKDSNNLSIDEDDVYFDFIEGDCRYLAIEFLNDKKQIGKPSDVFSIGVTFFEMITGKEMPSNGPLWEQLRSDRAYEFLDETKYSGTLYQCILAMMRTNITERLTLEQLFTIPIITNLLQQRNNNPDSTNSTLLSMLPNPMHIHSPEDQLRSSGNNFSPTISKGNFIPKYTNNNLNLSSSSGGDISMHESTGGIPYYQPQAQQQQTQQQQQTMVQKTSLKSMKRVLQDSNDGGSSQKVCAIRRSMDTQEDLTMSPRNLLSVSNRNTS
ncbi:hypothetical protein SAMD00019534_115810 [Acytostelium subglobosum LB1]|uniref:hypothetical protein n=1 Tax=Acytostelium subglobosum LB1 TaxID=1410327 RepID=UPI0006447AE0|nr:hypothetical protein SAMD00019534_115810 [Acytostelium subglobosum LB1]GAM28405.1 hypothetical protein SAMD00019534_115810 [Acytostelium subglobosum LB1]|eukprot:XP_012748722.1 hypothetical protein SAMD00019534_115810 [Acytostelium subglobosum LB1]